MAATPTANGRSEKVKKQSKIVTLVLSSSTLSRFASPEDSKSSSSPSSTPMNGIDERPSFKSTVNGDNVSESNSTPAPGQEAEGSKKRKTPAAASMRKSLNSNIDTMPKPRGKPGPKKKPRLEDGTIDHGNKPVVAGATNHKLGPKANTGAINAGLRALDRSGTPCRRWERKGFQLKSFTGITWEVSTWKGGDSSALSDKKDGTMNGDSKDVSMQSSSDVKPTGSDVAMSNAGEHPDPMALSTPAASSPVPLPAQIAVGAQS